LVLEQPQPAVDVDDVLQKLEPGGGVSRADPGSWVVRF
jgi:hypothetical protein